jgi:hypothetical protein
MVKIENNPRRRTYTLFLKEGCFMYEKSMCPILIGSHVIVELLDLSGEIERREFTIVPEKQADFKAGLLGETTPLGCILLGRLAGDKIPYRVGDLQEVRILEVKQTTDPISSEFAEKRRAIVQEAVNQSEIISQLIFATARGSKWGEYDVDVDKLLNKPEDNDQERSNGSASNKEV